ncbi:MAG: Ig-like domain-containing protein [Sphingobacteriales bacterium]|nr:Ig-like domain-containing protein [Sphingobacteriales bacterium]
MIKRGIFFIGIVLACQICSLLITGCAQIGSPTGGPKDTSAPVLIKAIPSNNQTNFSGNKITLNFDEYVDLQDIQSNLLVSPSPKNNPNININLRTITIKLKDSLLPNTTYAINFSNAIKDINEGNVLNNFVYTFSTGAYIDSLTLDGKLMMAETGKIDSSLNVLLYKNASDTDVTSRRPDYVAKLKGDGSFTFKNLPAGNFKIFALKDGDGNKYYNAATEPFAFSNTEVNPLDSNHKINLFAYSEKKQEVNTASSVKNEKEKRLKLANNFIYGKQDLLNTFQLTSNSPLQQFDADSILLMDTSYVKIKDYAISIDSSRKKISIDYKWPSNQPFNLVVFKNGLSDSSGLKLLKNDTIKFFTKSISEYGSLKITFKNIDLAQHPILYFLDGENVKYTFNIQNETWENKMMLPGDFSLRILYDKNNNGQWDPGNYKLKLQPEISISLPEKINIKADWENEREIVL